MRPGPADWHDAECSSYTADLPLWRELASRSPGPVLDLGCGTGRVALDLAERGQRITAVDVDAELLAQLSDRGRDRGLPVTPIQADVRELRLEQRFGLAIAAMQIVQLLGGAAGRSAMLERVRYHLMPRGRLAVALADAPDAVPEADALPPLPDILERDGWVLSSQPLTVRAEAGGVAIERLRQRVSPSGELSQELHTVRLDVLDRDQLEREAAALGLRAVDRREVPPTDDHVGSSVVVLERPA